MKAELRRIGREVTSPIVEELELLFEPTDTGAVREQARKQIRRWLNKCETAPDWAVMGLEANVPFRGWPWSLPVEQYAKIRDSTKATFRENALELLKAERWQMRERLAEHRKSLK